MLPESPVPVASLPRGEARVYKSGDGIGHEGRREAGGRKVISERRLGQDGLAGRFISIHGKDIVYRGIKVGEVGNVDHATRIKVSRDVGGAPIDWDAPGKQRLY
jgi:hypothetical protein